MVKQETQELLKKGDTVSAQLKNIAYATEQWMNAVTLMAARTADLSEQIMKFCKKDAHLTFSGKKFHDGMLLLELQAHQTVEATAREIVTPIKDHTAKYHAHSKKANAWLIGAKSEQEQADAIKQWVNGRFSFFSGLFANLMDIQEEFMSNGLSLVSSVSSSFNETAPRIYKPIEEVASTMDSLLHNAIATQAFKKFLDQECATESLNFILDADCFLGRHKTGASSDVDFVEHAKRIYNRYIKPNAENQVNINNDITKDITNRLKPLSVVGVLQPPGGIRDITIFTEARNACSILLEHDTLLRFRRSPIFQELRAAWRQPTSRQVSSPQTKPIPIGETNSERSPIIGRHDHHTTTTYSQSPPPSGAPIMGLRDSRSNSVV